MTDTDAPIVDLRKALSDSLEGEFVTKYILIAETYAEDGERYLRKLESPDLAPWDRQGMMFYHDPDDEDY